MPLVKVDGIEIKVPRRATVLQACESEGKEMSVVQTGVSDMGLEAGE